MVSKRRTLTTGKIIDFIEKSIIKIYKEIKSKLSLAGKKGLSKPLDAGSTPAESTIKKFHKDDYIRCISNIF